MRVCIQCGAELPAGKGPRKFCGDQCMRLHHERVCICGCELKFVPSRPDQKYFDHSHYAADYVGKTKPRAHRRYLNTCSICGETFVTGGRGNPRPNATRCQNCTKKYRNWTKTPVAFTLDIANASYLAGLVDGEGSIFLYERHGATSTSVTLRLVVLMTKPARSMLEEMQALTGVGSMTQFEGRKANWQDSTQWIVNAAAAASVITQISPYLRVKQQQAQLALEFWARHSEMSEDEQQLYRSRMQALNARGKELVEILPAISEEL